MDTVNAFVTRLFDALLAPLEWVGDEFALLAVSGVFGVLALWVFKHISWQRGIKATKNRIKGHLIEIRLYQDDLRVVGRAIGRILVQNVRYLALNFGPFVPLAVPFTFVIAQMVVRYAFDPVEANARAEASLERVAGVPVAGHGLMLSVRGDREQIASLEVDLPEGVVALSELARHPAHGRAHQELAALAPGEHEITLRAGGRETRKKLVAGPIARPRTMQPERVTGLATVLWPAEESLAGTGFDEIAFAYPESDLGWLPGSGPLGVILVFLVASMVFGILALKPLGVEI